MRFIRELAGYIKEEAEGAGTYAKAAVTLQGEGKPNAAQLFYEIAQQELNHADKLHELVVKEINAQRNSGVEIPAGMEQVWQWKHEELMDETAHAKELLSLYKR